MVQKLIAMRLLAVIVIAVTIHSAAMCGVDRIVFGSGVTPLVAGNYTAVTTSLGKLYAVRPGGIDWITDTTPNNAYWISVPIMEGNYVSITNAPDGMLYAAVAGDGIDRVYWSGQWMTQRIAAGNYVSLAANTDPAWTGFYAAGASGGVDRIYLDGAVWKKASVASGPFISLAPDTRGKGDIFAVRSDGSVVWAHGVRGWTLTPLIAGKYVSVAPDTLNNGNCYAVRSDGAVDHIVLSGEQWNTSTVCTGSYKAIAGDLTYAGQLYGVALDASTGVADAKKRPDNAHVQCTGLTTGYYDGYFYLGASDRIGGIRVALGAHKTVEGCSTTVTGVLGTLPSGERYIRATSANQSVDHKLRAIMTSNRDLGGGSFLDTITGAGQVGMTNGAGLNNVGSLMKTCGRVTSVVDIYTVLLTDGSGAPVKCVDPWGFVGNSLRINDYAVVTGVVSLDKNPNQNTVPVVILTDWTIIKKGTD